MAFIMIPMAIMHGAGYGAAGGFATSVAYKFISNSSLLSIDTMAMVGGIATLGGVACATLSALFEKRREDMPTTIEMISAFLIPFGLAMPFGRLMGNITSNLFVMAINAKIWN